MQQVSKMPLAKHNDMVERFPTNRANQPFGIRGALQSGLARLMFRINRPISGGTLGRPPRRLDFQRQNDRNPARCQPITVSGRTMARASRMPGTILYTVR